MRRFLSLLLALVLLMGVMPAQGEEAPRRGAVQIVDEAIEGEDGTAEDAEGGLLTANIDFSAAKLTGLKETINAITATPSLLTSSYVTSRKLEAPIAAGEELGTVSYQYNGVTMFTAPLIASRDVAEAATVVSDTASPNSSPLIVSSPDVNDNEGGSGWLFWTLLIAALVIIVLIAKVLSSRRRRRRAKKRSFPTGAFIIGRRFAIAFSSSSV